MFASSSREQLKLSVFRRAVRPTALLALGGEEVVVFQFRVVLSDRPLRFRIHDLSAIRLVQVARRNFAPLLDDLINAIPRLV